jgi:hypothetical protein
MTDADQARTEQLKALCTEHCPQILDALRNLYNAGLIPGARALHSVTLNGTRHGAPVEPGVAFPVEKLAREFKKKEKPAP